jgi:hypothetical protein
MGRPSILPLLKQKLGDQLTEMVQAWESQPEENRVPTLPLVNDKVNVRELARLSGFTGSQEQHLFKEPELRSMVNAVASEQGVEPIGSRTDVDSEDMVILRRLRRIDTDRSDIAKNLAEREAMIERLRRELDSLHEQIALLEQVGLVMRLGEVR